MNKTIQFNSEFLSTVSKKKSLNGTRKKEKPSLSDKNNSKVLRQKLLERIKEYQNRTTDQKTEESSPVVSNQPTDDTFTNSLEILKGLSSGIGHNKTVKHKPTDSDVSIEMPDCLNVNDNLIETPKGGIKEGKIVKDEPIYSCIKNGNNPTYRELFNNAEIQNKESYLPNMPNNSSTNTISANVNDTTTIDTTTIDTTIDTTTIDTTILPNRSENVKEHILAKRPGNQTRKRMITKTYKYMLGKNGRNVSVLLKDMKTRKMVKKECSQLSNTPIHDIKQYLRKKNLLKIGSNATDDVVTKIYEQAVLTGEVRNMSKDTLIHNFMKT